MGTILKPFIDIVIGVRGLRKIPLVIKIGDLFAVDSPVLGICFQLLELYIPLG